MLKKNEEKMKTNFARDLHGPGPVGCIIRIGLGQRTFHLKTRFQDLYQNFKFLGKLARRDWLRAKR
jgi:hypothetical protein